MTPHNRIGPLVGRHDGRAWLRVPVIDDTGAFDELVVPLDATALIRLAAEASAAALALVEHARRTRRDAAEPASVSTLTPPQAVG